jgi:hypothetical protein
MAVLQRKLPIMLRDYASISGMMIPLSVPFFFFSIFYSRVFKFVLHQQIYDENINKYYILKLDLP